MTGIIARLADPPHYREMRDPDDRIIGLVMDEGEQLSASRRSILTSCFADGLRPVAYDCVGDYGVTWDGWQAYTEPPSTCHWFEDADGVRFPVAHGVWPGLMRPGVALVAAHVGCRLGRKHARLFGLALSGLMVSAVAPLAHENTSGPCGIGVVDQ